MKFIPAITVVAATILSTQTFAAPTQDLEANSLIKCVESSSIPAAAAEINDTLASPFWNVRSASGNFYLRIKDYVSSAPVITSLANGNYSVCVTVTRKK